MSTKIEILESKVSQMKKENKYTMLFLSLFGSLKRFELKSEETIDSMLVFLIAKGY
jgi:predicted nucleotidyltransferase